MNKPGRGLVSCAVGPKGSGKSYWIKKTVRAAKKRILLFDSTGEYRATGQEGIPGLSQWGDLRAFFAALRGGHTIGKEAILASRGSFEAFCRFAFALGGCTVVIEEASRFLGEARSSKAFLDLCDRSRHARIELIAAASRPMVMPLGFRNQVDRWIVFRSGSQATHDFFRREFDRSTADRIRALKKHQNLTLTL